MTKQTMKIISWNVNGIRACYKKGLMDFLLAEKPDAFCVQETKAHLEQVEPDLQRPLQMHSYWSSAERRGYSGVATFSVEQPLDVVKGIGIPRYDSEGRVVITRHPGFLLYNIYFPNGGSGQERHQFKQEFLADLNAHLKEQIRSGEEIILVGDYNVAHKEIDLHDPVRLSKTSGFLPEERQWFDRFMELGFVDSFRHFHPQQKGAYSWWDYRTKSRPANRGWRIDYICVTKNLAPQLVRAEILQAQEGSDHCPVLIELAV